MRIKTARALRSIDGWKQRLSSRYERYLVGVSLLMLSLRGSGRTILAGMGLLLGLSLHFAALQFGSILVLGAVSVRLYSFRFANMVLRISEI